jgi:hypothetical protein
MPLNSFLSIIKMINNNGAINAEYCMNLIITAKHNYNEFNYNIKI